MKQASSQAVEIGRRIRELRKSRNMTMVELAEMLEVSQPAISQWESGITSPHRETLMQLSKIFKTPVGVLLGESPMAHRQGKPGAAFVNGMPVDVPVHGVAVGGASGDFRFNGQVVDYVRRPPGVTHARNVYALWVVGDSMAPWNKDGDLIYVTSARPPASGDYVVVQMNDEPDGTPGVSMVKQLVGKTPTLLKLLQHNPAKEFSLSLGKVKAIHKVLSLRELLGV